MEDKFKHFDVKKAIDSLAEAMKMCVRVSVGTIVVSEEAKKSIFGFVRESCDNLLEYLTFIDSEQQKKMKNKEE